MPSKMIDTDAYQGSDRREPKKVAFDPTINLGHVLTFIGFLLAGAAGWQALDKRVALIESQQAVADRYTAERAAQWREMITDLKNELKDTRHAIEDLARASAKQK